MAKADFEIRCPKCSMSIMTSADQAGEKVACPRCQSELLVPGSKTKPKKSSNDFSFDDLIDIDIDDDAENADPTDTEVAAQVGDAIGDIVSKPVFDKPADPKLNFAPDEVSQPVANPFSKPDEGPDGEGVEKSDGDFTPIDDADDDLGDLLKTSEMKLLPTTQEEKEAGKDPFEIDENANLVVDGITPQDSQFPVDCNICGSLMYARLSQVGTQLKCPDCFSMIDVETPHEIPKRQEIQPTILDDDGGYSLSAPSELDPMDTTIDKTLDLDYDDQEFFDKRRRLKENELEAAREKLKRQIAEEAGDEEAGDQEELKLADPLPPIESLPMDSDTSIEPLPVEGDADANLGDGLDDLTGALGMEDVQVIEDVPDVEDSGPSVVVIEDDDDDEYFLAKPVEPPKPPVAERTNAISGAAVSAGSSAVNSPSENVKRARFSNEPEVAERVKAEPDSASAPKTKKKSKSKADRSRNPSPGENSDFPSFTSNLGSWINDSLSPLKEINSLVRFALCGLAIGVGYLIAGAGVNIMLGDSTQIMKFVGFGVTAAGVIPILLVLGFLGVIGNSIIRVSLEKQGSLSDWPEFSIMDYFSQFIYVATSFWAAALPGALLGFLVIVTFKNAFLAALLVTLSGLTLTPFFLASVIYNESPWMIMTSRVFDSVAPFKFRYLRFWAYCVVFSLILSFSVLAFGHGIWAMVVAFIQVAMLFVYFWMLGDLLSHVVRWLIDKANEEA